MARTREIVRKTHVETHYADGSVGMFQVNNPAREALFTPNRSDHGAASDLGAVELSDDLAYYTAGKGCGIYDGRLPRNEALVLMRAWVKRGRS